MMMDFSLKSVLPKPVAPVLLHRWRLQHRAAAHGEVGSQIAPKSGEFQPLPGLKPQKAAMVKIAEQGHTNTSTQGQTVDSHKKKCIIICMYILYIYIHLYMYIYVWYSLHAQIYNIRVTQYIKMVDLQVGCLTSIRPPRERLLQHLTVPHVLSDCRTSAKSSALKLFLEIVSPKKNITSEDWKCVECFM